MAKCENCYHAEICKNYPNTGLPPKMRQELIHKGCEYYINNSDVQEVKHGKWIRVDDTKCKCSCCDIIAFIALYPCGDKNYCPNCGARMDGDE